ncbi:MAG: prenyltransferase/squalene oxidase repeat-containing protein [Planctomycetota bacterium]
MPSRALAIACLTVVSLATPGRGADAVAIRAAIDRGVAYLKATGQDADGSFSPKAGPAVTALAVTALVRSGVAADDPAVAKAVAHLLTFRQTDGGIHTPGAPVANYETAIAVMALVACNADGRHDREIATATAFLRALQWDEGEGRGPDDPAYGGAGYGRQQRPDLSNTQFFIDALRAAGAAEDDPAIQRALAFVSRTQNLPGPHNDQPHPAKNPDGGFYYTPAAGGESQAGKTPDGGLRSYGSMTYAGLKSMIYAGVDRDDPRVKAALAWLAKHYTFAENPGMADNGLFYYFHTAAKSLDAFGGKEFRDAAGADHAWRDELSTVLLARQRDDGSWTNANARWMEGDANLVTAYSLLALSYCLP